MKMYEYKAVIHKSRWLGEFLDELNEAGNGGYRIVGKTKTRDAHKHTVFIMERESDLLHE